MNQIFDCVPILNAEAGANLEAVRERIQKDVEELHKHPDTMPPGIVASLPPRLLDALPEDARDEYDEAKKNLLVGAWTSAVRCNSVAIELSLRYLYTLLTKRATTDMMWDDVEKELGSHGKIGGKRPSYIIALTRDVRINYRNTTAHGSERIISDYDGIRTFHFLSETLRRIAEAILSESMPKDFDTAKLPS